MMHSQNRGAARYGAVRSHGLVADASPTRLVQIMFEQVLSDLATAGGCMARIVDNRPLNDITTKGRTLGKAVTLIGQLDSTLDMSRGGEIAANLHSLYTYMLARLTVANATNDPKIVAEVAALIREVKQGWDQIVTDSR